MPNHFHAIVIIGDKQNPPMIDGFPDTSNGKAVFASPIKTVGSIVRGFKGASTSKIWKIRENEGKIWQYNYYEHIIRNEEELERIRKYINDNPAKWQEDKEQFKKLLAKMKNCQ